MISSPPDHQWVIQVLYLAEQDKGWTTMSGGASGHLKYSHPEAFKFMQPNTLESCIALAVDNPGWNLEAYCFRIYNVNTEEVVPFEILEVRTC